MTTADRVDRIIAAARVRHLEVSERVRGDHRTVELVDAGEYGSTAFIIDLWRGRLSSVREYYNGTSPNTGRDLVLAKAVSLAHVERYLAA